MPEHGEPVLGSLYIYAPNKPAAIFFTIVFAFVAAIHIGLCHRYKSWKLTGLQAFCATLFTLGYAFRSYGAHNYTYNPNDFKPVRIFILSQIFIFVGPPFAELANFYILGRVFQYVPHAAPFNPARVTAFFGALLAAVEALSGSGVALFAKPNASMSSKTTGHALILTALALQVVIVLLFIFLAAVFHGRCVKAGAPGQAIPVKHTLITLYISMGLIFVRSVFRLAENSLNSNGVDFRNLEALTALNLVLRYEAFFYVFEASLMLVNSVLWIVRHPARHVPRETSAYMAEDGTLVEKEGGMGKRRALPLRILNHLAFGLLIREEKSGP